MSFAQLITQVKYLAQCHAFLLLQYSLVIINSLYANVFIFQHI